MLKKTIESAFGFLFNEKLKTRFESLTLYVAALGFVIHLIGVFLFSYGWIDVPEKLQHFLSNPISAIYTPFSFILVFEVYLLIYYLPRSFSISIAKQYEIVSLILIRRIFKDISGLGWDEMDVMASENVNLLYDIGGFLILFLLIFVFRYLLVHRKSRTVTPNIEGFIRFKKTLCILLVPILLGLSIYSFANWVTELNQLKLGLITTIKDFNDIFYHEFFAALIIVDVFILIASFRYTDRYSLLIRNTGFVITTILIRLSFSAHGLGNILLLIGGVLFGVIILYIFSLYDKIDQGDHTKESYAYL